MNKIFNLFGLHNEISKLYNQIIDVIRVCLSAAEVSNTVTYNIILLSKLLPVCDVFKAYSSLHNEEHVVHTEVYDFT